MQHEKIPHTAHQIHDLIKNRWSARSFDTTKSIDQKTLNGLFEAASWAASSMNEQPWRYVYAHRGTPQFDGLVECLMDGNQPWAKNAAVLMVALSKKKFDKNGKSNRHFMHDTGSANTTMLLQATSENIFGHMMGGFHMDQTIEHLELNTEDWEPACFIALGYRASADELEDPFKTRELTSRKRNNVASFTQNLST